MSKKSGYDFSGWASKNDLTCMDGLVIRANAFAAQDGQKVPLVYNHQHKSLDQVLGHAILENRDEGLYAYGYLNNTSAGRHAKETLEHGDIESLSIWADTLDRRGKDILHGVVREVSLVLAGANPGAFVESVVAHGVTIDEDEDECLLFTGEPLHIAHANDPEEKPEVKKEEEEEKEVKHSLFEKNGVVEQPEVTYLSHSEMKEILDEARTRRMSLKEVVREKYEDGVIAHSIDTNGMTIATGKQNYGVNDVSMLLPDYKSLNTPPEFISRNMTWVTKVMAAVHRTPFSRIKSLYANITEDEARARGYIKGKQKKEEVFTTLKRTTDPQTVYKKQKLDRDDVLDITDFDVVSWIRSEMRVMLNEEIARAILMGDGRPSDSDDKIQELHIRPVVTDVPLFNVIVKVTVPADADEAVIAKSTINAVIRSRKNYKGSGNPSFWTTEDVLTEMLLLEDGIGHKIYKTELEVATALRVSEIVPVEPMEGHKITVDGTEYPLIGTIVNLADYNVGADKGAMEDNMFEDFDIDYNQMKYLIEKRMSGALVKPFSAITLVLDKAE